MVVTSQGQESVVPNMLFFKTSPHGYENLCSVDVLGVMDEGVYQDKFVYDQFKKQVGQNFEGC